MMMVRHIWLVLNLISHDLKLDSVSGSYMVAFCYHYLHYKLKVVRKFCCVALFFFFCSLI